MKWVNELIRADECVTVIRLRFADDLVLLAFSESGFQHGLNGFAAACDIARMKISTSKTEYYIFREILSNVLCKLAEYH